MDESEDGYDARIDGWQAIGELAVYALIVLIGSVPWLWVGYLAGKALDRLAGGN